MIFFKITIINQS